MKLSISMTQREEQLGWLVLALQLAAFPALLVTVNAALAVPLSDALLNCLLFVINFIVILFVFRRFLIRSARQAAAAPFQFLRFAAIGLALYYIGIYLIGLFIGLVYPQFSNVNDSNIQSMAREHYGLILVGTVLLVPVTEEALFRGLIFRTLQQKSRLLAYILSTLSFGLVHVTGYIGTASGTVLLLCLLQYVPAGLCFAWAYEKADTVWAPILMHMAINQISMSYLR